MGLLVAGCVILAARKCLLGLDRNQPIHRDRASGSPLLACEAEER